MSMTHDEMIAVITRHNDGGKIQYKRKDSKVDSWIDVVNPSWDFSTSIYRAKPEPLILWVALRDDNEVYDASLMKNDVEQSMICAKRKIELKKFVEVIE